MIIVLVYIGMMITIDNMITNTIDNSTCLHWYDDHLHLKVSANVWRPVMWRANLNILPFQNHHHAPSHWYNWTHFNYTQPGLVEANPFNWPEDSHDSEYLSDSPHLTFVLGLASSNTSLNICYHHCYHYHHYCRPEYLILSLLLFLFLHLDIILTKESSVVTSCRTSDMK